MTNVRWAEILSLIQDTFEVLNHKTEVFTDREGKIEIIEFIGPMGKMRLERTDQPLVIDKKVIGSKRIGSEQKVEYIYSDTERVHKFRAMKWDEAEGKWVEMEMERGGVFT